jgi:hypothetical protein
MDYVSTKEAKYYLIDFRQGHTIVKASLQENYRYATMPLHKMRWDKELQA